MTLEQSVRKMVERLQFNRFFPKYQFERSLDGFLSIFLEEYFSEKYQDQFVYVAAEFPMRKENEGKTKRSYQSTNVDYLLLRKGKYPQWYFVELKTDQASERDIQLERLNEVDGKTFVQFDDQIEQIKKHSKRKEKYRHLRESIDKYTYLTPSLRQAKVRSVCITNYDPKVDIKNKFERIEWLKLSDFDKTISNTKHSELWQIVKILFEDIPQKVI